MVELDESVKHTIQSQSIKAQKPLNTLNLLRTMKKKHIEVNKSKITSD